MSLDINTVGNNSQQPSVTAYRYVSDQLIAGQYPIVTDTCTLQSGKLPRGAVLGQITVSSNVILSVRTAGDGSQTPCFILADDADATGGPVSVGVYLSGEFTASSLILDASWTVAQVKAALRPQNIYVKSSITANDPT
jgi:Bacteriophage lambda head decoration protein D